MADPVDASSIPALVQRLRSGRRAEQLRAAQQLRAMAAPRPGSDSLQTAIAAAGAIPALVPLMGSSSNAVRAVACGTLTFVVLSPGGQDAFMAAGGLEPLQDCLFHCSDKDVQHGAASLATNLLLDSNPRYAKCHAAIASGIPTLVRRLGSERPLAASMAGVLRNLFGSLNITEQEAAVAAGAVAALAQLLASGEDDDEQEQALSALANLAAAGNATAQDAIAAEGLIPNIVERLSSESQDVQRCAAAAVHNMTIDTAAEQSQYCEALAAAGAIPGLVLCLATDDAQLYAARALHNLCHDSPQRCREAEATGAVAALQRALQQSSDEDVQEAASVALRTLQSATAAAAAPPSVSTATPPARQPAAVSPTRRRPPAPRVCAAPGCGATHGLKRCGGCGTVRYCSEACSRAHWREHRAECRRLQAEQAVAPEQPS